MPPTECTSAAHQFDQDLDLQFLSTVLLDVNAALASEDVAIVAAHLDSLRRFVNGATEPEYRVLRPLADAIEAYERHLLRRHLTLATQQ